MPKSLTSASILPRRRLMIMANMDSTSASLRQVGQGVQEWGGGRGGRAWVCRLEMPSGKPRAGADAAQGDKPSHATMQCKERRAYRASGLLRA